ncbi:ArsR/SmtB family transcription factor [Halogeometricum limi]|uniref:Helix-turn-helix domain-containing protein n=1 Tax=Halogeometricum limi TaxID=555875 RepID=A0A1I6FVJ4_9EURY|nr:winged helix-turn-helix domain-containing protein [Halogeometricum limi]SFR33972.1 Helix-turn-helix domain-containing protein [Halogeometricum limi]
MADILPTRPDPPEGDKEPRVVGIDSDEVSELLSAISSNTARAILSSLHDEPATPSEVAARVDTSIQNAQYHLGKLEDADLIESGGTAYSEKGREMTVYTPADRALVVVAGNEDDTGGLQTVLSQLLGGLGAVALGSVVVERLTTTAAGPGVTLVDQSESAGGAATDGGSASGGGGDDGATTAADAGGAGGATNATAGTTPTAAETEAPERATETPAETGTPTATDGDAGGFGAAEATTTEAGEATRTDAATSMETATAAAETEAPTATETAQTVTARATETASEATRTAVETSLGSGSGVVELAALSPAELFFLGGVLTLAVATAYWMVRR